MLQHQINISERNDYANMAGKKTKILSKEEFNLITCTMAQGCTLKDGQKVRPNYKMAMVLILQANLGLRLGQVLKLHLTDFEKQENDYTLRIIENNKNKTIIVPKDIITIIENYYKELGLKSTQRMFNFTERAVQIHLQKICTFLNIEDICTQSFRKFFAYKIYDNNPKNISILQQILQLSSRKTTENLLVDKIRENITLPFKMTND